jgi:hypothetical protein
MLGANSDDGGFNRFVTRRNASAISESSPAARISRFR